MKREHSIGARVNDTSIDTMIDAIMVNENSWNRRPTMPPINSSGTNTASIDRLIENTVKAISREPSSAACIGGKPFST
ncbi:hypothetical protein RLIN73S_01724 [Rhodanobacter lindaniclasticus]